MNFQSKNKWYTSINIFVSEFITSGVAADTVSAVGGVKKLKISSEQYRKNEKKPCLCPPRK